VKSHWKSFVYRNGYLLITAAWLYTISFLFINYWSYRSSPAKVKSSLEKRLTGRSIWVDELANDTLRLEKLVQTHQPTSNPAPDETGIFLYEGNADAVQARLLYWNTNQIYVDPAELNLPEGIHFINHRNGDFQLIRKNIQKGTHQYSLLALIPIRWNYFIENKYLRANFAGFNHLEEQYEIVNNPAALPVQTASGKVLFNIQIKSGKEFIQYDTITILLRLLAILFLLAFLHNIAVEMVELYSFRAGFGFLASLVLLLRWLTYQFHIPFDFSKIPLFDPAVYASNAIHPSLGDLLVNTSLAYWLLRFYRNKQPVDQGFIFPIPPYVKAILNTVLLTLAGLLLAGIVGSLIEDAKISFDVSNFFSLSVFSLISFIILCLLVLIFFYLSEIWLIPLIRLSVPFYQQALIILLVAFAFIFWLIDPPLYTLYAMITAWMIGYVLMVQVRKKDFEQGLPSSGFFIFWVMFFALSISTLVVARFQQVEWKQREKMAEKLVLQSDPFGENLLNIAATNFEDKFLQTDFYRFAQSEATNKMIKDSLIRQNFSGYLNKYNTRILTFESKGVSLFNEDTTRMEFLDSILQFQSQPTEINDLFAAQPGNKTFRYLFKKIIQSRNLI
jgi:hypothetical protein